MKKFCTFVMALVLMVGIACSAMAYDEEIIWQDIKWGSKKQDVLNIMKKNKWIKSEGEDTRIFDFNTLMNSGMGYPSFADTKMGLNQSFEYFCTNKKDIKVLVVVHKPDLKVAGYEVKKIECTFSPNDQLMTIGISFETPNGDKEAFEDLAAKLESVYGAGESYDNGFRFIGAENTAVILEKQYGYGAPYLVYGKTDWKETMGISIPEEPEAVVIDPTDNSGL